MSTMLCKGCCHLVLGNVRLMRPRDGGFITYNRLTMQAILPQHLETINVLELLVAVLQIHHGYTLGGAIQLV
jgi:hypothetical protein